MDRNGAGNAARRTAAVMPLNVFHAIAFTKASRSLGDSMAGILQMRSQLQQRAQGRW